MYQISPKYQMFSNEFPKGPSCRGSPLPLQNLSSSFLAVSNYTSSAMWCSVCIFFQDVHLKDFCQLGGMASHLGCCGERVILFKWTKKLIDQSLASPLCRLLPHQGFISGQGERFLAWSLCWNISRTPLILYRFWRRTQKLTFDFKIWIPKQNTTWAA